MKSICSFSMSPKNVWKEKANQKIFQKLLTDDAIKKFW